MYMYVCIYKYLHTTHRNEVSHALNDVLCDTYVCFLNKSIYSECTHILIYLPILIVNKLYGYTYRTGTASGIMCTYVFSYI